MMKISDIKIEHIALWVNDLDVMKDFYIKYFSAKANDLYHNPKTGFKSYFLTFDNGCRIELMQRPDICVSDKTLQTGYSHLAFSVGSQNNVDELTELFRKDGYTIKSDPRTTGDGYYESSVLDPENNIMEITL